VTLCHVRHRPAIDLKIERKIPSEVRHPVNGNTARRNVTRVEVTIRRTTLRNSADEHCTCDRNNDAGEAVFGFHGIYYTSGLDFR
jgi:hypothetical protein